MHRLSLLIGLAACGDAQDYDVARTNASVEADAPQIRLDPEQLDLGAVDPGTSTTASFSVWNDGGSTLDVSGLRLVGSSDFVVLTEAPLQVLVGESATVEVQFTPTVDRSTGMVWVDSDDPDDPTLGVALEGDGLYPRLGVSPDPLLFGTVPPGCPRESTVTLTNIGGATLTVDNVALTGSAFNLTTPLAAPVALAPGESTDMGVELVETELGDWTGNLYVSSDQPAGMRRATVSGTVAEGPSEYLDDWRQPDGPWPMTDILFYVDQSCSMEDDQQRLRDNFSLFTGNLDALLSDYQLAVVTGDDGCHNGTILTPETEGAEAVFGSAVSYDGTGGYTERGLTISWRAVQKTAETECNAGFLRDGSKPLLVMVSDEEEQSFGDWQMLTDNILGVAPEASIVSIVGDVPGGCDSAVSGDRYYSASMYTGGMLLSICEEDWAAHFLEIASLATEGPTDTFVLTWVPDLETLVVVVDAVESTDWDFDVGQNAVVFRPDAVPPPGAWIEARYGVKGDCEE